LRKDIELLIELDRLEDKIIRLKEIFKDIPEKKDVLQQKVQEAEEDLEVELENYEEQKSEISYLQDELNEINEEIATVQKQILQDTSKGKNVKSLEDNLFQLKRSKNVKEEEISASHSLLKDTEDVVNEVRDDFNSIKKEAEQFFSEIKEREGDFDSQVKEIEEFKAHILSKLGEIENGKELKTLYGQISEAFPGGVVAKVEYDSCSRCFMQITPQVLNELQRESGDEYSGGRVIRCASCSCILYYDANNQ
jgi:predicted  nucleic acid-binding Zn-ribbon protein